MYNGLQNCGRGKPVVETRSLAGCWQTVLCARGKWSSMTWTSHNVIGERLLIHCDVVTKDPNNYGVFLDLQSDRGLHQQDEKKRILILPQHHPPASCPGLQAQGCSSQC